MDNTLAATKKFVSVIGVDLVGVSTAGGRHRGSWLMSSTTPSATRNSASLDRLLVENGRSCSVGVDLAIFLISRRSGRVNVFGRPPTYFGNRESNPSVPKVVDHVPDPVGTGERHSGDLRDRHPLGGQQDHLRAPPGHHRSRASAHNAQQPWSLVVIDLANCTRSATRPGVTDAAFPVPQPGGVSDQMGQRMADPALA